MRQKFFDIPFAVGGDLTVVPDAVDPGGDVSFNQGYGPDFQIDPTTDATGKYVDRMKMNYLLNAITTALQAIQETGVPEWIDSTDNGGVAFPYSQFSHVLYSATAAPPFIEYVSMINANTDTPGTTANWQVFLGIESTAAQALAGADFTTTMTPRRVASAIAAAVQPLGDPTGSVAFFAQTAAPSGYVPANGALVSRVSYANLFNHIGTTWGAGDGATTFSLPDLRGRFPRGYDNGAGVDPGRVFGSVQAFQNATHNHPIMDPGHNHTISQSVHNHGINDPSHIHGLGDPGHAHAVADPSHVHGVGDPGHAHAPAVGGNFWIDNGAGQDNLQITGPGSDGTLNNTSVNATGIYLGGAYTGIGIYAAGTGLYMGYAATGIYMNSINANVANVAAVTGITTAASGGTEARPVNVALLACIKF